MDADKGKKIENAGKGWSNAIGKSISGLSAAYAFIKSVWASMEINNEILDWFKTSEGIYACSKSLKLLGREYLEAMELDKLRFSRVDDSTITVNFGIRPKLELVSGDYDDIIALKAVRVGNEAPEIKKIGDDLYIGGRKVILRLLFKDELKVKVALEALAIDARDSISASHADALCKNYDFIPKNWLADRQGSEDVTVVFTGTTFEGNEDYHKRYRTLIARSSGWGENRIWWNRGVLIYEDACYSRPKVYVAVLEPMKKSDQ